MPHPPIVLRPARSALVALGAFTAICAVAGPVRAFEDTHLNEITSPLAADVGARVAVLEALPAPTKPEKAELKRLRALDRKLAKSAVRLSQDFAELNAAAAAVARIRPVTAAFDVALDEGLRRARIALQERDDLTLDHRALVGNAADARKIDAARSKAVAARSVAEAATDRDDRARLLARAEVLATKALTAAEKFARRTGQTLPPVRLRSGDVVGPGGARVAVPRGTGSGIDGSSVLVPPGAFSVQQTVTLAEASSFVGGRDLPAGRAVAIALSPGGTPVNGAVTVFLPWSVDGLPSGTDVADVTLFRDDAGTATPLTSRTLNADGTVSAASATVGTFQPGVQAPPLGKPDGRYVVHMLAVVHAPGVSADPPAAFDPGFTTGIAVQEVWFRRDGAGSASSGAFAVSNRTFLRLVPHHADVAASTVFGGYEFLWDSPGANRFAFSLPLQSGQTAAAEGVASTDGNVIVFKGRGGTFDFLAVGLRTGAGLSNGDLAGRWTGAQFGIDLLDGGTEPFRTRWHAAARDFTAASNGLLTFGATGTVADTTTEYRTLSASPIHVMTTTTAADGGTQTVTVNPDGRLSDASNRIRGLFSKDAGVLVLAVADPTTKQVSLMFAARQPATVPVGAFVGSWNLVRFEAGFTTGTPDTRSSTQEVLARTGTLFAAADGTAGESLAPGTNAVYSVNGALPLGSMTWTIGQTTVPVLAAATPFTVTLDATGGNHRPAGGPVWYSVSGDGSFLLGTVPGTGPRGIIGVLIGLR